MSSASKMTHVKNDRNEVDDQDQNMN